jgi:hypothetical protein
MLPLSLGLHVATVLFLLIVLPRSELPGGSAGPASVEIMADAGTAPDEKMIYAVEVESEMEGVRPAA